MFYLFYCMNCGARCDGALSSDIDIVNTYIRKLESVKTVRLVTEGTASSGRKHEQQEPALGNDAHVLWEFSGYKHIPVFDVVSYRVLEKKEIGWNKYNLRTEMVFSMNKGYMESRNSLERTEIFAANFLKSSSNRCPICGEPLVEGPHFIGRRSSIEDYEADYSDKWNKFLTTSLAEADSKFQFILGKPLSYYEEKRVHAEVDDYVSKLRKTTAAPVSHVDNEKINLQTFLNHLFSIETDILFLTEHLKVLLPVQYRAERLVRREQFATASLKQEAIEQKRKEIQQTLSSVRHQNPILSETVTEADLGMIRPQPPVLKKGNIFNRGRIERENSAATAEYEQNLKQYLDDFANRQQTELERRKKLNETSCNVIQQEEDRLSAELRQFEEEQQSAGSEKTIIQLNNETYLAEIANVKEHIKQLCNARSQYLSSGIIHPKYTDFVAIATIYEYFETGRCTTLAGPDGAYNLYENEIRAERIIAQLDEVISSLDAIKANQYRTYCALKEINEGIHDLSTKLRTISLHTEAIANNTAYIAYNTAKTAHYAKINAELTNALGYMVALS